MSRSWSGWSGSAFTQGALSRALGGVLFALCAIGFALLVERVPLQGEVGGLGAGTQASAPGADLSPTPAPAAVHASSGARLLAESTYAVAHWQVTAGSMAISGQADDQRWQGKVPGGELVVTAEPQDPTDLRLHALRLSWPDAAGLAPLTVWGSGAVTCVVPARP